MCSSRCGSPVRLTTHAMLYPNAPPLMPRADKPRNAAFSGASTSGRYREKNKIKPGLAKSLALLKTAATSSKLGDVSAAFTATTEEVFGKGRYRAQVFKIVADTAALGVHLQPGGPIPLAHLHGFVSRAVLVRNIKASSLWSMVGQLRAACTVGNAGYRWCLAPAEEKALHLGIKQLVKAFPTTVRKATPVTKPVLRKVYDHLLPALQADDAWA